MPVNTPHPLYGEGVDKTKTVRDAVKGARAVKKETDRYLPIPNIDDYNSTDIVRAKQARQDYADYLLRAQFLGITGLTLQGFVGAIFRKPPTVYIPDALQYAFEDADGAGSSLTQLAKQVCIEAHQAPFVAVLVDYPQVETGLTEAQRQSLNARAVAKIYPVESVINFRYDTIGAKTFLSLAVLRERISVISSEDGFTAKESEQYRVLQLIDGNYRQSLYDSNGAQISSPSMILANGAPLKYIPLHIAGAQKNAIDYEQKPLLEDIADANLAHYRNSADYEENLFFHGRSTLFLTSDISQETFDAANPEGIRMGSRSAHFLGANGSATLLQSNAASALEIALASKLEDMQRLGAKLITPQSGAETAEAARIRASAESSQLDSLVDNVSEAIEAALESMALFMGTDPDAVNFELNRELFPETLSDQDVTELRNLYADGLISREQVWDKLRRTGWIDPETTDDNLVQQIGDNAAETLDAQV